MLKKYTSTIIVFTVLVSGPAFAEDISHELDEVVVTASRVKEKLKDAPVTINVVSGEELEKVKYRNAEEVLTRLPGVYTHDFGGEAELTSIRVPTHFTNPYTVVLVDGVPVNGYGSGSSGQLGEINSDNIARIELVKGPASALYGSNAIGGIINVITKDPGPRPQGKIWAEYGAYEMWRSGVSGSAAGEKTSFNIDLNRTYLDGWREHTLDDKKVGNVKIQYLPTENSLLAFKVDYLSYYYETGSTLKQSDFDADWQQSLHTFTYTSMDKLSPSLTYNRYLDDGEFRAIMAVRDLDHEVLPTYGWYKAGPNWVGSLSFINSRDTDLQLLYSRQLPWLNSKMIVGLDTELGSSVTDRYKITPKWTAAQNKFTSYTMGAMEKSFAVNTTMLAPYLQLELPVREGLKLTAGGRYDTTEYDVEDRLNTGLGGNKNFAQFTPKLGATYDFSPSINTYLSYSQGFVVPTTSQLLTTTGANGNLLAEEASNYEAGLRGSFLDRRLNLDLALYTMEIKNKIVTDAARNYLNAAVTSNNGLEATAVIALAKAARLTLGYTLSSNKYDKYDSTGVDYGGKDQPRSPQQHLNARLGLTPLQGLELELEMDAVSSQYADDGNTTEYSRPTLFNLRASYDWRNWSLWAHVKNLTDQKYATYVSWDSTDGIMYFSGSPATFFAGLSYKWGRK